MKILFTSPIIEFPASGGPSLRIENSIKALAKISEVHVVYRGTQLNLGGERAEAFYRKIVRSFQYSPSSRFISENRYIRKAISILNDWTGIFHRADAKMIIEYAKLQGIDTIWFGYGNISHHFIKTVRKYAPEIKLICDTDSVWSRFILRELPYATSPFRKALIKWNAARKQSEEKQWIELCNVTTAVSEVDSEYYRSISAYPERVHVFSNVIDVENYKNPPEPLPLKSPSILLAGNYGHANSPMDVAARWLIDEVMPIVWKQIPSVHLYVIGKGSDKTLMHYQSERITVGGKVPSMLPYLFHVNASAVPLKFESGTRYKILEGGACKTPLISTTLGAEGIPVVDQTHLLIADDPQSFASSILKLVQNPALGKKLAAECRKLVEKNYSVEKLAIEGKAIIEYLTDSKQG